jgi:hypothetical protein
MSHAPYNAVKGCSAEVHEIRSVAATMVLKWDGSFSARVAKIRLNALNWIAVADSELSPTVPEPRPRSACDEDDDDADKDAFEMSVASIEDTTTCILRGMQIANSASILLRSQLVAHRALGLTYDPDHIVSLISLMEVLKAIEKMLRVRRRSALLAAQRSTLKMLAQNILSRFNKVRCVLLHIVAFYRLTSSDICYLMCGVSSFRRGRSFVDKCSSSMDFSHNSDRARCITRISACLTALECLLQGTTSFSPIRRLVAPLLSNTCLVYYRSDSYNVFFTHLP